MVAIAADANDWPPVGTPLAQLCERLEGLTAGLCAVAQWPGCDEGWAGTVELCGEQAVADRDTPVDAPVVARARPARLAPVAAQQGLWALWLGPDNGALNPTRRHLEDRERLLFTSHSLAVGEMATTLAHELNQPLGAVGNVLRGLKARLTAVQAQPVPPTPQALQQLARAQLPVIAITDSRMSPLVKMAEAALLVQDNSTFGFRALTSTMGLAQSLFIALAYALELPYRPTSPNVSN